MRSWLPAFLLSAIAIASIAESASAYYNTSLGRFVSRDPIGYGGSKGNLYSYAEGKPLTEVDPMGLANTPPGEDPAFNTCWKAFGEASEQMKDYIDEINNRGCHAVYLCGRNCKDKECADNPKREGYSDRQLVVVCSDNHNNDLNSMIDTWRHEIAHRYDKCLVEVGTGKPSHIYFSGQCFRTACLEMRGAAIGNCYDGAPGRAGGKSFEQCVKDRTKASMADKGCERFLTDDIWMRDAFYDCVTKPGIGSGGVPDPTPWPIPWPTRKT